MTDSSLLDSYFPTFFSKWLQERQIEFELDGNFFRIGDLSIHYFNNLDEFEESHDWVIKIWYDQWQNYPQIVLSRLKSLLGLNAKLPARVCKVRRIDQPVAIEFLNNNHLQQAVSSKIKYGMFLPKAYFRLLNEQIVPENEELLVAVMTFSGPKKYYENQHIIQSYELIRFANLLDLNVVGGFSKMLRNFIREKTPGNIMTYVDADWSDGHNFGRLNFNLIEKTDSIFFRLDEANKRVITRSRREAEVVNSGSYKYILSGFGEY